MASEKIVKLEYEFFENPKIKKLRKLPGGDKFVIIYLKLRLLACENQGKIFFQNIENTFEEELSLITDENLSDIISLLDFLKSKNLVFQLQKDIYIIKDLTH